MPGMKHPPGAFHLQDRDIGGKQLVETPHQFMGLLPYFPIHLKMHHLPQRVHAGVGPARNRHLDRCSEEGGQRPFDLLLNRPQARLIRPTRKSTAVVLQKEPSGQTSSSSTISVESDRRGPSFRIRV